MRLSTSGSASATDAVIAADGGAAGEYVLAIDIGTGTQRAALMDRGGHIADIAGSTTVLHTPAPGHAEQSPDEWWNGTARNIRAVLDRHPGARVAGVGVGAQMHGVVPLAADGRVLDERVGIWSDKRAAVLVDECRARSDIAELCAVAGNDPVAAWAGFKTAWYRVNRPEIYAEASVFLIVKDFINYRLTGTKHTDPTEASGSFLMDAATDTWSPRLVEALGLDAAKLPEIAPSGSVIGYVTAEAAAQTGLAEGTPVAGGAGDMLCQLLAAGITRPGRGCDVSGTASIICAFGGTPEPDPRVMNLRAAGEGWIRFGIADAGGLCLRWIADRLSEVECEEAKNRGVSRYDVLTALADGVPPGSNGLLFFPYLLGERTMGSSASRGSFIGLTPAHGRPEMVRAVLEGLCLELRRTLELIVPPEGIESVRITGGGALSDMWNQIRADTWGTRIRTFAQFEGGLVGAGILGGVGVGWYADPASAAEDTVQLDRTWDPSPATRRVYDGAYREFCAVHDLLDPRWRTWEA